MTTIFYRSLAFILINTLRLAVKLFGASIGPSTRADIDEVIMAYEGKTR